MALVVRQVAHRAGRERLCDLSFCFDGGVLAVLGPAHSGKELLVSLLAGVIRPDRGQIQVDGGSPTGGLRSGAIGYVPLGAGLTPGLTVAEAFDFYLMLRRVRDSEERRTRIAATLERFGLEGAAQGPTSTIPPSIAFVVTIAQACLIQPAMLIVHEPAELTSEARNYARAVLRNIAAQHPVVLAAEEARGIDQCASSVCILEAGTLRVFGSPEEVTAVATGRTWETELAAGQEASFVYGFVATRQEATASGTVVRGVSHGPPAPQSRPVDPDFFDGYSWCLATDEAAVNSNQSVDEPRREAAAATAGGAR